MSTRVGAYEAKTKLPEILRRVESGERFTITNRGTPVAEIVPPTARGRVSARAAIERMKTFQRVKGVSGSQVRAMIESDRR